MILVIDNYDSFVHNLARYIRLLGLETKIVRNDQISIDEIRQMRPEAIVLSPGPCSPSESGICVDVVRQLKFEFPILGICLGHQAIVQAFGGVVSQSRRPMHGQASIINHDHSPLFRGVKNPFQIGRYHSLIAEPETLPQEFIVHAKTEDGIIMAVSHESLPIVGFQFHPESILTEFGMLLLENVFAAGRQRVEQPRAIS